MPKTVLVNGTAEARIHVCLRPNLSPLKCDEACKVDAKGRDSQDLLFNLGLTKTWHHYDDDDDDAI